VDLEDAEQIQGVEAGESFYYKSQCYERRVISFASRSLHANEKVFGVTKLEGAGLTWSLLTMDPYIRNVSIPVKVYTDHKSPIHLFSPKNSLMQDTLTPWAEILCRYNFTINYVEGTSNYIPDLLSRSYSKIKSEESSERTSRVTLMKLNIELDPQNLKILEDLDTQKKYIDKYHAFGHFGSNHIAKLIHKHEHVHWNGIYKDIQMRIGFSV
jgi:hypothetical protein